MTVEKIVFDRESDWLEARRKYVSATEVSRLIASAAFAFDLREEKLTGVRKFTGNKYTDWGKAREPEIFEWLKFNESDIFEKNVTHNGGAGQVMFVRDGKYSATPDGFSDGFDCLVEIKTTKNSGWADVVDLRKRKRAYYDQVQWQLFVTGASYCWFAWEVHEDFVPLESGCFRIEADSDRQQTLKRVADEFLNFLADDVSVSDSRLEMLLAAYAEAIEAERLAKDDKDAIASEIRAVLGAPGKRAAGGFTVALGEDYESVRFDSAGFKAEYPELFEKFYTKKSKVPGRLTVKRERVSE